MPAGAALEAFSIMHHDTAVDALLLIGTAASLPYIQQSILRCASQQIPIIEVNPNPTWITRTLYNRNVISLPLTADSALPTLSRHVD